LLAIFDNHVMPPTLALSMATGNISFIPWLYHVQTQMLKNQFVHGWSWGQGFSQQIGLFSFLGILFGSGFVHEAVL